ncbi:hypothetical protein RND71_039485 [Anisodus tanguticus]|uniref:Uncharacterized protein n=1 Tax=Anisodus tanguticus TaxID=243964 RepID=A0AAE1QXJ4_9SOLA|nr:hypothetical protein RND71_039485 [Anisodus tanguticus]
MSKSSGLRRTAPSTHMPNRSSHRLTKLVVVMIILLPTTGSYHIIYGRYYNVN